MTTTLTTTDVMTAFGAFLRLYVADGDASPATVRSYYGNAAQFVAWCGEHGINPATVTEDDIATYHRELVAWYEVGTVAVRLAAIRRLLYEAAVWRRLLVLSKFSARGVRRAPSTSQTRRLYPR